MCCVVWTITSEQLINNLLINSNIYPTMPQTYTCKEKKKRMTDKRTERNVNSQKWGKGRMTDK